MKPYDSVDTIKGVGDKTKQLFEKIGIHTVWDLLCHYPTGYERFEPPVPIEQAGKKGVATVEASVISVSNVRQVRNMSIVSCDVKDPSGVLKLTWFNQNYILNRLRPGYHYLIRGKVERDRTGRLSMTQPVLYTREEYEKLLKNLAPKYALTKGLTHKAIAKAMQDAFSAVSDKKEEIPTAILKKYGLMKEKDALREIHFPKTEETVVDARKTLAFREFFWFLFFMNSQKENDEKVRSEYIVSSHEYSEKMRASLPYSLTGDQSLTFEAVRNDMSSGYRMSRLVQGDVGSGKTVIAALALADIVGNGFQGALMAPTEVLAWQHYEEMKRLFEPLGVKTVVLTGSTKAKERREILAQIENGEAGVIVGTHALIGEKVNYRSLGLVITDEQHRFGVKQREGLQSKGQEPHILVMSATPIPRSLALIMYGDMDISVIKELPKNRLPIKNCLVDTSYRPKAHAFIEKEVKAGHQAFIICPMVEEGEEERDDLQNVKEYESVLRENIGSDIRVQILHGRMKSAEKDRIMEQFASGESDVLISTTVVEVGINVPNATVMLIENAERFGLAALHQLRGRIGRGSAQGYCIFISADDRPETMERLGILNSSNDGFFIASEDLRLRGPGDMFGIRQSGDMAFKIADIYSDADILSQAKEAVSELSIQDQKSLYQSEEYQLATKRYLTPENTI